MPRDSNGYEPIESSRAQATKTILLVDEDPNIGAALRHFFAGDGYQVLQATTVPDAMVCLEQNQVDLIITDLRLSRYSGLSLLIRVRAIPQQVPVIVMSAYSDFMSAEDWKLLGATEFISKPPDLLRLREVIARALEGRYDRSRSPAEENT